MTSSLYPKTCRQCHELYNCVGPDDGFCSEDCAQRWHFEMYEKCGADCQGCCGPMGGCYLKSDCKT